MERRSEPEGKFYFHFLAVPAEAFLNPNLTQTDVFLFSLIKNMSNSGHGCWASNQYFADILRVTKRTISNSISSLESSGYINSFIDKNKRHIFVDQRYKAKFADLVELFNKGYVDDDERSREQFRSMSKDGA